MTQADWIFILLTGAGILLSILWRKLTVVAALTGGISGLCIYKGIGIAGILLMAAFFLTGTLASSWKQDYKQKNNLAETGKSRRTAGQVWANAGLAALIGLIAWMDPSYRSAAAVVIASCFSSATADTVSSELGNVYGKQFYDIMSFKKASKGANGIISAEGSLLGFLGSGIIAFIYSLCFAWSAHSVIILAAGTIGNIADSVLGATLERKGFIGNNMVNFCNTLVAAIGALILLLFVHCFFPQ